MNTLSSKSAGLRRSDPFHKMTSYLPATRRVASLLLCIGLATCATDDTKELRRLVPDLPPEFARHLTRSDDETLATFGLEYGYHNTQECWNMLKAFEVASDEDAAVVDRIVTPSIMRLPVVFREYPAVEHVREWVRAWQRLALSQKRDVAHLAGRFRAVRDGDALDLETREATVNALIERYEEYPVLLDCGEVYATYIDLLNASDRAGKVPALLERAIEGAIVNNHHTSACHLLGVLGGFARQRGDEAAMFDAYYRGLEIAQHCSPGQEARLLSFIGTHYSRTGRFTMAHELFRSAEEVSRAAGGQGNEIRYYFDNLTLHASLRCWGVIGSDLQRFDALARRAQRYLWTDVDTWSQRIGQIRMRHRAATGDFDRAEMEFRTLRDRLEQGAPRGDLENLLLAWTDILIDAEHYNEAYLIVLDGIARCQALFLVKERPQFYLKLARIEFALDRSDACRRALDDFERFDPDAEPDRGEARVQHDLLRARLALADGDAASSTRWIESALSRTQQLLEMTEATSRGYLGAGAAGLREFLRTSVEDDAVAGFALELYWGRSVKALGAARQHQDNAHPLAVYADIVGTGGRDAWRSEVVRYLEHLESLDATHCVYAVSRRSVTRWTARDGVVTRDILDVTPDRLTELTTRARAELIAPVEDDRPALRELSALLLTRLLGHESRGGSPRLLISAEGALADLPFEALALPGGDYEPVIRRYDVAYVRGLPETSSHVSSGVGLVIADPAAAPALKRRYPGLGRALDHGLEEAVHLLRRDPAARSLKRGEATQAALFAEWTHASYLYFATHVLRDPELPYNSFIPMSPEPGNGRHESYLIDVSDIRGADLSRCDLVVLSGCSTGSGYQDHRVRAPALADAFIDAGCGAVVQTFWDVEDQGASRFMRDFIDAWVGDGVPPFRAVNDVRRRWCEAGADPSIWAAYSIVLGRL